MKGWDAEDSEAALFGLDGSDFWIGHPKRPAGSGEVAHFPASLEREPREGSCSACSTPSRANPQLLFEGEPCPIPPFLDAVDSEGAPVSPDVVAALRAQVRPGTAFGARVLYKKLTKPTITPRQSARASVNTTKTSLCHS